MAKTPRVTSTWVLAAVINTRTIFHLKKRPFLFMPRRKTQSYGIVRDARDYQSRRQHSSRQADSDVDPCRMTVTTREFGFHSDPPLQHTSPPFNCSIDPPIYIRTPPCTAMPHTLPSHFPQGLLPVPLCFLPWPLPVHLCHI